MSNRNIGLSMIAATLIAVLEMVIASEPYMFVWYPVIMGFAVVAYLRNVWKSRRHKSD